MPQIDYNALAQQAGAISSQAAPTSAPTTAAPTEPSDTSSIDYAALAKQAGAIESTPPSDSGILSKALNAVAGPGTAAGTPISPSVSQEASGASDILHGNIRQGVGKIWDAEKPHVVQGSRLEKLIQAINPSFQGGVTNQQVEQQEQSRATGKPLINVAEGIDKNAHPMAKAVAEAAQSLTTPDNVAILVGTGGLGLVDSPQSLGVAHRLLSAGFSANAVGQAYQHLKGFKEAYDKGDAADAEYQLTHAVLAGSMSYLAGADAAGKPLPLASDADRNAITAVTEPVKNAAEAVAAPVQQALENRAAKTRSAEAVQDFTDAHADVKKAIPSQGASRYEDTDMVRARDYLEKHHEDTQPIRSVSDYRDAADTEIKKIDGQVKDLVNIIPNEKIATNVLDDVRQGLEQISPKKDFVDAGMKALTDSYDLNDPTMTEADRIREDLNAENQGVMSKNNYKRSVARKTDPGFAARELAASSLRDGVYNQLENHGIEGARELRLDQGSLIKMRNAAEAQIPNGGKIIRGTGGSAGLVKNVAKAGITGTAAAAGGAVGSLAGPVGTGVGAAEGARIGSDLANRVLNVPSDLTRDQLIERSFGKKVAVGEPTTPTINLHGPAAPEPTGQQPLPTGPSTLFDINQTGPEAFAQRAKPYQDIIDSPNHTPAEKADAHQAMADLHKEVDKATKETEKQAKAASKPTTKAPEEQTAKPITRSTTETTPGGTKITTGAPGAARDIFDMEKALVDRGLVTPDQIPRLRQAVMSAREALGSPGLMEDTYRDLLQKRLSVDQPAQSALEAGQKALAAKSGTAAPKFQSGNRAIIASGETPKSPEWLEGERQHEVNRLKEVIRNPKVTPEELKIAQDRLFNYLHPEVIAGSNALK